MRPEKPEGPWLFRFKVSEAWASRPSYKWRQPKGKTAYSADPLTPIFLFPSHSFSLK